jgi:hypothetical protein
METKKLIKNEEFLFEKVRDNDVILGCAIDSPAPQKFLIRVKKIYSTKRGINEGQLGNLIEIVGSPCSWGNMGIEVKETAIIFISISNAKLYQDPWRGHFVVEKIGGVDYGIYQYPELWLWNTVPAHVREATIQDPKRPYASAIRFDVLEEYIRALIEKQSFPD